VVLGASLLDALDDTMPCDTAGGAFGGQLGRAGGGGGGGLTSAVVRVFADEPFVLWPRARKPPRFCPTDGRRWKAFAPRPLLAFLCSALPSKVALAPSKVSTSSDGVPPTPPPWPSPPRAGYEVLVLLKAGASPRDEVRAAVAALLLLRTLQSPALSPPPRPAAALDCGGSRGDDGGVGSVNQDRDGPRPTTSPTEGRKKSLDATLMSSDSASSSTPGGTTTTATTTTTSTTTTATTTATDTAVGLTSEARATSDTLVHLAGFWPSFVDALNAAGWGTDDSDLKLLAGPWRIETG
jgi:hypothetical protein